MNNEPCLPSPASPPPPPVPLGERLAALLTERNIRWLLNLAILLTSVGLGSYIYSRWNLWSAAIQCGILAGVTAILFIAGSALRRGTLLSATGTAMLILACLMVPIDVFAAVHLGLVPVSRPNVVGAGTGLLCTVLYLGVAGLLREGVLAWLGAIALFSAYAFGAAELGATWATAPAHAFAFALAMLLVWKGTVLAASARVLGGDRGDSEEEHGLSLLWPMLRPAAWWTSVTVATAGLVWLGVNAGLGLLTPHDPPGALLFGLGGAALYAALLGAMADWSPACGLAAGLKVSFVGAALESASVPHEWRMPVFAVMGAVYWVGVVRLGRGLRSAVFPERTPASIPIGRWAYLGFGLLLSTCTSLWALAAVGAPEMLGAAEVDRGLLIDTASLSLLAPFAGSLLCAIAWREASFAVAAALLGSALWCIHFPLMCGWEAGVPLWAPQPVSGDSPAVLGIDLAVALWRLIPAALLMLLGARLSRRGDPDRGDSLTAVSTVVALFATLLYLLETPPFLSGTSRSFAAGGINSLVLAVYAGLAYRIYGRSSATLVGLAGALLAIAAFYLFAWAKPLCGDLFPQGTALLAAIGFLVAWRTRGAIREGVIPVAHAAAALAAALVAARCAAGAPDFAILLVAALILCATYVGWALVFESRFAEIVAVSAGWVAAVFASRLFVPDPLWRLPRRALTSAIFFAVAYVGARHPRRPFVLTAFAAALLAQALALGRAALMPGIADPAAIWSVALGTGLFAAVTAIVSRLPRIVDEFSPAHLASWTLLLASISFAAAVRWLEVPSELVPLWILAFATLVLSLWWRAVRDYSEPAMFFAHAALATAVTWLAGHAVLIGYPTNTIAIVTLAWVCAFEVLVSRHGLLRWAEIPACLAFAITAWLAFDAAGLSTTVNAGAMLAVPAILFLVARWADRRPTRPFVPTGVSFGFVCSFVTLGVALMDAAGWSAPLSTKALVLAAYSAFYGIYALRVLPARLIRGATNRRAIVVVSHIVAVMAFGAALAWRLVPPLEVPVWLMMLATGFLVLWWLDVRDHAETGLISGHGVMAGAVAWLVQQHLSSPYATADLPLLVTGWLCVLETAVSLRGKIRATEWVACLAFAISAWLVFDRMSLAVTSAAAAMVIVPGILVAVARTCDTVKGRPFTASAAWVGLATAAVSIGVAFLDAPGWQAALLPKAAAFSTHALFFAILAFLPPPVVRFPRALSLGGGAILASVGWGAFLQHFSRGTPWGPMGYWFIVPAMAFGALALRRRGFMGHAFALGAVAILNATFAFAITFLRPGPEVRVVMLMANSILAAGLAYAIPFAPFTWVATLCFGGAYFSLLQFLHAPPGQSILWLMGLALGQVVAGSALPRPEARSKNPVYLVGMAGSLVLLAIEMGRNPFATAEVDTAIWSTILAGFIYASAAFLQGKPAFVYMSVASLLASWYLFAGAKQGWTAWEPYTAPLGALALLWARLVLRRRVADALAAGEEPRRTREIEARVAAPLWADGLGAALLLLPSFVQALEPSEGIHATACCAIAFGVILFAMSVRQRFLLVAATSMFVLQVAVKGVHLLQRLDLGWEGWLAVVGLCIGALAASFEFVRNRSKREELPGVWLRMRHALEGWE